MTRSGCPGVLRWLVAIAALGAVSCSGGRQASSGGPGSGTDAGPDGSTAGGCTTDSDCASQVPQTTPAGCAVGKCDTVQGKCVFTAKDEDGDGHTAADCTATDGTPIQTGDDCNDHDPDLYPGHPSRSTRPTSTGSTRSIAS